MTSSSRWVAALCALGLAACGGGSGRSPEVKVVRVKASGCTVASGTELWLSVTCDGGYSSGRLRLSPSAGESATYEEVLDDIPVETSCVFAASAVEHRVDVDVHYSASISRRLGRSEQSPLVVLVLQQKDHVASFHNSAPRVTGLTASRSDADMLGPYLLGQVQGLVEINADAIVLLNAGLYDPDGDPLWYRWDDAGLDGTFIELDGATMQNSYWSNYNTDLWMPVQGPLPMTIWIPPLGLTGTAYLTITVKDQHTGSGPDAQTVQSRSSLSVEVEVDEANIVPVGAEGGAGSPPVVSDMQVTLDPNSTGGKIFPGQTAQILAVMEDVDSLALSYNFMSSCPGVFFDALGNPVSDALIPELAPLDEAGRATLFAYFIPAVAPSTGTCDLVLYVDDGQHRARAARRVEVVASNPTLLGPDITLARATPTAITRDSEVLLEVAAQSRNTDPSNSSDLLYKVDILAWFPTATEDLPLPEDYFGMFIGETENHTGRFTWRSAADQTACMQANSLNNGSTFYFRVSVVDASLQYDENSVSPASPATNRVVIPVHVDCTQ